MPSSSSSWKPFCLGVLSASLVYMGLWVWNHDEPKKNDELEEEDDSFEFKSKLSSSIRNTDADYPVISHNFLPNSSHSNTNSGNIHDQSSSSLWESLKEMSRILTEKNSINHSMKRWRWESIRKKLRKKTSSTSQKIWETLITKMDLVSSMEQIPSFYSLKKSIFPYRSRNNNYNHDNGGVDTIIHPNYHEQEEGDDVHVLVRTSSRAHDNDDDDEEEKEENTNTMTYKNTEKSGLCIGSIFGLDVGGTLAKLVYFEKQPIHNTTNTNTILYHHLDTMNQQHYSTKYSSFLQNKMMMMTTTTLPTTTRRRNTIQTKMTHSQDSVSHEDLTKLLRAKQSSSMPEDVLLQFHNQNPNDSTPSWQQDHHPHQQQQYHTHTHNNTVETIRKSRSMFNLIDGDERDKALSKFYTFANNLDSYASGMKENDLSFYSRALGGDFHFIQFETRRMQAALELIRISSFHRNILHIGATGGGAHRFSNEFEQVLGIQIMKQDELDSMVAGLQFALRDFPNECYTFVPDVEAISKSESNNSEDGKEEEEEVMKLPSRIDQQEHSSISSHTKSQQEQQQQQQQRRRRRLEDTDQYWWSKKERRDNASTAKQYPYLVVMIGTGVSILRVDGPRKHERISGSTIGGGTYWGLCRLLTDAEDFQSALELAKRGDATKVDMLVGDIYGPNSGALDKLGLTANIVASSFGKLVSKQNPAEGLNQMDLARALLLMVTNNIGQVALLNARLHNTQRIFFIGNFLRHNIISQQRLAYSLAFWSQGKMEALFLEHEGYFGSLGAFLLSQGANATKTPPSTETPTRKDSHSNKDLKKAKRYRARSL